MTHLVFASLRFAALVGFGGSPGGGGGGEALQGLHGGAQRREVSERGHPRGRSGGAREHARRWRAEVCGGQFPCKTKEAARE